MSGRHGPRGTGGTATMQIKRAGLLTKLVVLAMLVGLSIILLNEGRDRTALEEQISALERQIAVQTQVNADLQDDLDHSGDLESQMNIARDELGLVVPGERVFHIPD